MKLLIVPLIFMCISSVHAKDLCNLELQGGLRITNSSLEFSKDGEGQFRIVNDRELWMGNKPLQLNQGQQLLVEDYAHGIRAMVPEVRQLTLDGVDLAADAMRLVFDEFLGANHSSANEINNAFMLLRKDIEKTFSSDQPIYFTQNIIHENGAFGKAFEARVNAIMETSGKEIAWSFIKAIGASIFSSGSDFEQRMEKFSERMEREMKQQAQHMEARGNKICYSAKLLDVKEEVLKKSVNQIAPFNFISIKEKSQEGKNHDGL